MADPPVPKGKASRKRLLIYGGVAVALLVVIMLRRNSAAATQAPADPALTPVGSPAASNGSGGVVDNSSQLAAFENGLLQQLPDSIASGISAGFANWVPAPAPAAATDPTTPSPSAVDWASMLSAATGLISVGVGLGGATNAAPGGGPTGTTVKAIPHPAAAHPPNVATGVGQIQTTTATHGNTPGKAYTTEKVKGGVIHHYADHNVFVKS